MDHRRSPNPLTVRISFEATRLGGQCLAEAYERLAPTTRRRPRSPWKTEPGEGAAPTMRRDDHA